ncbi:hypothetical protein POX_a01584 [Penicillium oxalicum]|uniref:hypothetical protein n=1 Tax=Penicillium oxalicum TaxID=69781 RepID=UPI0020B7793B|nr:hypothetical protein POX_a01584 [Penicillium oxalicum]KAI2794982.1 hypothetical protein POX_a01584 [Penicillium oxalicum]
MGLLSVEKARPLVLHSPPARASRWLNLDRASFLEHRTRQAQAQFSHQTAEFGTSAMQRGHRPEARFKGSIAASQILSTPFGCLQTW